MNAVKHTPTPWIVENNGSARSVPIFKDQDHIASVWNVGEGHGGRHANAAHIVKCVNAHDALVSALKSVTEDLRALVATELCDHPAGICWCGVRTDINEAETALKVAGIEVPK